MATCPYSYTLTQTFKILFLLLILSVQLQKAVAQDIHFSQFFETPLWRNPSLAGIFKGDVRVQAVYRDQWNSVTNAYRTGSVNAELKLPIGKVNDFITTGVQIMYDKAGSIGLTTIHVLPVLNYHKSLSSEKNRYLSLGFMGGGVQRSFDPTKVTTNTQYDNGTTGENFLYQRYGYIDGSVGMSYNSGFGTGDDNNFFLGAAYHHINKPKKSFYGQGQIEIAPKWVFSSGLRFGVSDYAYLTFQADHTRQAAFTETVAGGMYGLKIGNDPANPDYTLHAGGFLRLNDAFVPVVKLDYNPFSVTLSYDVNVSKLKPSSYGRGGFELSVSYTGFRKEKGEYLLCPRF
jgi:type IX secretion system PorP/SprF family membrane protein